MFDENESYDDEMQEIHECDWDCYGRHSGYPCKMLDECENVNKYDGAAVAVLFVIIIFPVVPFAKPKYLSTFL